MLLLRSVNSYVLSNFVLKKALKQRYTLTSDTSIEASSSSFRNSVDEFGEL